MALVLNEEQGMLRDSAKAFLAGNAPVAHLRKLRDEADDTGFSRPLWSAFAEQGYTATLVPEAHGGLGLGMVEAGIVAQRIGHTLTPTPFLSTAVLGACAVARAGSKAQATRLLPAIAAARVVVALAVDETTKHRPSVISTVAQPQGGGFVIDGSKLNVVDGHVADELIVVARTNGGLTLFLVPAASPGVSIERTVMVDAHNAARVRFTGVKVGADAVLGQVDGGAALLAELLDAGRLAVAAELLGIADEVFERTLAYLKERRQFDKIIGEFQALQHRAAELFCDIEMTRAIVLAAQQAFDADPAGAHLIVAQAKARACLTGNRAVLEGVQMHGGMGMTDAFDMGLFMKRARVLQELFGDAGFHAGQVATLRGY
jgi:acyl-CoA dehydrogenase